MISWGIPPKSKHTVKECLRYALPRGIPLRMPRLHPFNPLLALRVTCAADSEAERRAITHALFALGWVQGGDLSAADEIAQALSAAGLRVSELMELAQSPTIKEHLRAETDAAIARGVFGVPTMLVDDELFWGVSQLPNLELYLTDRDPLAGLDPTQFMAQGIGAWRPDVSRS
jgi:2-hydroxychromene-2-carboxylate isomerase